MEAYSLDLRRRVAEACDAGIHTREEIADLFQVSVAWIRRLLQRRRETGSLERRPHAGGHPPALDDVHRQRLVVLVAEDPDATLTELRARLRVAVSLGTLCRTLARLGLPRKKSLSPPASATGPTCSTNESSGVGGSRPSTPSASSSWTRRRRTSR